MRLRMLPRDSRLIAAMSVPWSIRSFLSKWILIQSASCICPRIKVTLAGAPRLLLTGKPICSQMTENKCAVAPCICHRILPLELFQRAMKTFPFWLCAFVQKKESLTRISYNRSFHNVVKKFMYYMKTQIFPSFFFLKKLGILFYID